MSTQGQSRVYIECQDGETAWTIGDVSKNDGTTRPHDNFDSQKSVFQIKLVDHPDVPGYCFLSGIEFVKNYTMYDGKIRICGLTTTKNRV